MGAYDRPYLVKGYVFRAGFCNIIFEKYLVRRNWSSTFEKYSNGYYEIYVNRYQFYVFGFTLSNVTRFWKLDFALDSSNISFSATE